MVAIKVRFLKFNMFNRYKNNISKLDSLHLLARRNYFSKLINLNTCIFRNLWWIFFSLLRISNPRSFYTMVLCYIELAFCAGDRLRNFVIATTNNDPFGDRPVHRTNYDVCATEDGALKKGEYKEYECVATAAYLIIQLRGKGYLTLCEVEVFGGRYRLTEEMEMES